MTCSTHPQSARYGGVPVTGALGVADSRREQLVAYLLAEQMDDGGWNCRPDRGGTHGSFHTTINVVEGLRDYVDTSSY